jgi:predicted O-linked N-acetylglucosamine transferase (SPINDLY family)
VSGETPIPELLRSAVQLHQARRFAEAESLYQQILSRQPGHADALQLLGVIMYQSGRNAEAIDLISRAIAIAPQISDWYSNLGGALRAAGRTGEAIAALRRAVQLKPQSAVAHFNLGNALAEARDSDQAIAEFRLSLSIRPDSAECLNNLGIALKDRDIDQSVECYRKAVKINPTYDDAWSNLLLGLHYRCCDRDAIFREHVEWGQLKLAQHRGAATGHPAAEPHRQRKLRVGYVSGDFREHSVSYFSSAFLRHHDPAQFEIYCYDNTRKPDAVSTAQRDWVKNWRRIVNVDDQAVAGMIRQDQIDILVDLSGHSGLNRLPVFAYKPAPVQVTYVGYPNTTGLGSVDYRITDAVADPPGLTDSINVEKLVRLPDTAWCYTPNPHAPPVNALPATRNGFVTFVSCNNLAKLTAGMLELWGKILLGVDRSRLIIQGDGLHDQPTRDRVMAPLLACGVNARRIELLPRAPSTALLLPTYNRADIALDTYPYHGTTTTCEALWMGLPLITLSGNMHVARVSTSLLTTVGLAQLIAESPAEYLKIAEKVAGDIPRLARWRQGMRERLLGSPLMDARRFTAALENAYLQMWRDLAR